MLWLLINLEIVPLLLYFYFVLQFLYSLIQFCLSGSSTLDFIIYILFKSNIIRLSTYQMIQNVRVIFINQLPPILHIIIVQ